MEPARDLPCKSKLVTQDRPPWVGVLLALAGLIVYCCLHKEAPGQWTAREQETGSPNREVVPGPEAAAPVKEVAPSREVSVRQDWCPNKDDAIESLSEFQVLVDDAEQLAKEISAADEEDREKFLDSWKGKEEDWRAKNEQMLSNCGMLLSAHGTPVFPEIPLALKNMKLGGQWLEKSVDLANAGKTKSARAYIRGARAAARRAGGLLDGKVRPDEQTGLIETPQYIRAIES